MTSIKQKDGLYPNLNTSGFEAELGIILEQEEEVFAPLPHLGYKLLYLLHVCYNAVCYVICTV